MEMKIHAHCATLTPEQKMADEEASKMPKEKKPLNAQFIGVSISIILIFFIAGWLRQITLYDEPWNIGYDAIIRFIGRTSSSALCWPSYSGTEKLRKSVCQLGRCKWQDESSLTIRSISVPAWTQHANHVTRRICRHGTGWCYGATSQRLSAWCRASRAKLKWWRSFGNIKEEGHRHGWFQRLYT